MFDFLFAAPYENRKVARHDGDDFYISTASVNDGSHPYETAICHPDYNDNKIVIVEAYDSRDAALTGHDKWVKKLTAKKLPKALVDCGNSGVEQLCQTLGSNAVYQRRPAKGD